MEAKMQQAPDTSESPAYMAEMLAGCMSRTSGLPADRVGRAFLRSLHMQANDPLPLDSISMLPELSLRL